MDRRLFVVVPAACRPALVPSLTSIGPTTGCADNSTYLRTTCGFWGCAQITPSYLRSAVSARRRKWLEKVPGSRFRVQG